MRHDRCLSLHERTVRRRAATQGHFGVGEQLSDGSRLCRLDNDRATVLNLLVVEHQQSLLVRGEADEIGALVSVCGIGEDLQSEGALGLVVDLHNGADDGSDWRVPQLVSDADWDPLRDSIELLAWGLDNVGGAVVGAPQDSHVGTFGSETRRQLWGQLVRS